MGQKRTDIVLYLISTPDNVQQFEEPHELGSCTDQDYEDAFRGAGLHAERAPAGSLNRVIYIARHMVA